MTTANWGGTPQWSRQRILR